MNDVQTPWISFPAVNLSSKRWMLVARSTWLSEPDQCAWIFGVIAARRRPRKTEWDRMLAAAIEADVDPLDEKAFSEFQRVWVKAHETDAVIARVRRWASTPTEDDRGRLSIDVFSRRKGESS